MDIRVWSMGLLLVLVGSLAHADDQKGFYAGSGAGLYYVDFDDMDYDESAASIRIFGGYQLNEYVSFEAGYASLFETSADVLGADIDIDGNSWDISVRPTMPLTDNMRVYGIIGFTRYEFDISISALGVSASDDDSGSDLMYGFGGMFDINDSWSLRGEWTTVDVDDADFGMLSISATYNFR
ncbi:MAG: porin family protein [Pseudomonadales bacterium]